MNLASTQKFQRTDRVSQTIKKELSDILLRKVADPRLHSITITGVEVARDFMVATVKVCRMLKDLEKEPNEEDKKEVLAALSSAKSFIFQHLKKRLDIRFVPNLRFEYDFSLAESSRVWGQIRRMTQNKPPLEKVAENA
jgi:ribosome-binding factor A